MRLFVYFLLISWIAVPGLLRAQSFTFLPENTFRFSYEYNKNSRSRMFVDTDKRTSILSYELDHEGLGADTVNGTIQYETLENKLVVQAGLTSSINVGLGFPSIKRTRKSNIEATNASDMNVNAFVNSRKNNEQSDMGDREFWFLWRANYTDIHDFQIGLNYNDNNGLFLLDESDELSLGSGARELTQFFRWIYYEQSSRLAVRMEASGSFTEATTVTDSSGNEVEMTRGNGLRASVHMSGEFGIFRLGGEIKAESFSPLIVDGVDQSDGYLGYSYRLDLNLGNINMLEEGPLLLPWEVDFYVRNRFWGVNAPGDEEMGAMLSLYF